MKFYVSSGVLCQNLATIVGVLVMVELLFFDYPSPMVVFSDSDSYLRVQEFYVRVDRIILLQLISLPSDTSGFIREVGETVANEACGLWCLAKAYSFQYV